MPVETRGMKRRGRPESPPESLNGNLSLTKKPKLQPAYIYRPLPRERVIRVLEVEGAEDYDDELVFNIIDVSLDEAPDYAAISYCWDGQIPSKLVVCENQTLLVTANCEAALKQLRHSKETGSRLLWIDAICINQSADAVKERNHQVAMMGDVYAKAKEVLAWLGSDRLDPEDLHDGGLQTLHFFRRLGQAIADRDDEQAEEAVLDLCRNTNYKDLDYMRESIPWFERTWVLQEVALAKSAYFIRDNITFSFADIIAAKQVLKRCVDKEPPVSVFYSLLWSAFEMTIDLQQLAKQVQGSFDPTDILQRTRLYLATNPRDKVFGLYSFLQMSGLQLPPPDYNKDTATVYRETVKAVCLFTNGLDLVVEVNGLHEGSGLSSWSPNLNELAFPFRPSPNPGSNFRASGDSRVHLSFSGDGFYLSCRLLVLETVGACAGSSLPHIQESLGVPEDYFKWSRNQQPSVSFWFDALKTAPGLSEEILMVWSVHVLQEFVTFALDTAKSSRAREDRCDDLRSCLTSYVRSFPVYNDVDTGIENWRSWQDSLVGENDGNLVRTNGVRTNGPQANASGIETTDVTYARRYGGPDAHATEEIKWLDYCQNSLEMWDSKCSSITRTPEYQAWRRICSEPQQASLHSAITSTGWYQTLFRTASSNRLGMAPHSIREGDCVALVAGLHTPMIIRHLENGHYKFVAPAYICGIMEGQVWDEGDGLQDFIVE